MTDQPENQSEPEPELAVRCPTCASKPGERCASLITAQYRDEVHAARRRAAKETA